MQQQSKPSLQAGPAFQGGFRAPLAWACLGLLLALTAQAYWPSLGFDFVWDDHPLILKSDVLFAPDAVFRTFFRNFWDVGGRNDTFRHFYRPMVTLSYWLNLRWNGLQPWGFHAVNLGLHLACVALAFALFLDLLGDPFAALLAGVFFALHPTHVENVAWISGRTDLLAAVFALTALWCWRRADHGSAAWILPGTVAYFAALLSKEVAVLLPLAWLALPLHPGKALLQGSPLRRAGLWAALVALLLYLSMRWLVLGMLGGHTNFPGLAEFGPALGWVLAGYTRLVFGLGFGDPHYSDLQFKFMRGAMAWQGWALLAAFAGASLWLLHKGGPWARGAWLTALFLLPVLSLGSFGDVLYADRFLYLPSLGLGLLFAMGVLALAARLPWHRGQRELGLFAAAGILGLLLQAHTVRSSAVWADDVRLFETASRSSPDSVLVWNNLCLAYTYAGRYPEAEQAGRRAIALDLKHAYSQHNLGVAIREQKRPLDALPYLERAAALEPQDSLFSYNLAEALAASGDRARAELWYRRTLQLKPENQEARHNLGYLLLQAKRFKEARPLLEAAAAQSLHPAKPLNSLGILAAEEGRLEEARACFEKALSLEPGLEAARKNLEGLDRRKKR